ncbi:hypothetical protein BJ742DRAFT_742112 [Cladochytrium replicatum]|nr:hypothetical protein BJ742DRAFT_742112 [Cladochytrium replicatum]
MATLGPRPGNVAKPPENQAKILKWTRALNKKSVHFQEEDAVLNAITLPKKEVPVEPQQGLVAVEGSSGIAEENKADEHMHAEDDEAGEKERAQSKSEALDVSHASVNGNGNGSGEDAFGHSEAASALAGLAGPSEDGGGTPAAEQENSSDHGEDDADLDGMDVDEPQ